MSSIIAILYAFAEYFLAGLFVVALADETDPAFILAKIAAVLGMSSSMRYHLNRLEKKNEKVVNAKVE